MGAIASQITSLTIVYSTVYSDADERKHQSSVSLAFVRGILPETGEFPAQMASNAENVSIWWRHHDIMHTQMHVNNNSLKIIAYKNTILIRIRHQTTFILSFRVILSDTLSS